MPMSTAASPTKLCRMATSCGIWVISTFSATEMPMIAPTIMVGTRIISGTSTSATSRNTATMVATMAIAMPTMP